MAIRHAPPPADGKALLEKHASHLGRESGLSDGRTTSQTHTAGHVVSKPHPVYELPIAEILAQEGQSFEPVARLNSWRYFLQRPNGSLACVILGLSAQGTVHFAGVRDGPAASRLIDAISRAEALAPIRGDDWELRGFLVPGLMLMGFWFHARDQDILFPVYGPAESGVVLNKLISAEQFLHDVRPYAHEVSRRPRLDPV